MPALKQTSAMDICWDETRPFENRHFRRFSLHGKLTRSPLVQPVRKAVAIHDTRNRKRCSQGQINRDGWCPLGISLAFGSDLAADGMCALSPARPNRFLCGRQHVFVLLVGAG